MNSFLGRNNNSTYLSTLLNEGHNVSYLNYFFVCCPLN